MLSVIELLHLTIHFIHLSKHSINQQLHTINTITLQMGRLYVCNINIGHSHKLIIKSYNHIVSYV